MSVIMTVLDTTQNYYPLRKWEELLRRMENILREIGKCIEFQITADSSGPLSVVIITYDRLGIKSSDIVRVRDKSFLQAISDIFNSICPATPPIIPDVSRHEKKQRKTAASRGKEAV